MVGWLTSLVNVGGEGADGEVVKVTGRDQLLGPAELNACNITNLSVYIHTVCREADYGHFQTVLLKWPLKCRT